MSISELEKELQKIFDYFGTAFATTKDQSSTVSYNKKPEVDSKKAPSSPGIPSGWKRMTKTPSVGVQSIAQQILERYGNKPYGTKISFRHGGKKYIALIEEHIGGKIEGKHPGVSLLVPTYQANELYDGKHSLIENEKINGKYRIATSGGLVSRHMPGEATKTHSKGHFGVDIRNAMGAPVYAIGPGKVIKTSNERTNPSGGNTVTTSHENGRLISYYAHLDEIKVSVGDTVNENTVIGTVGNSGMIYNGKKRITEPHLHWQVKIDGNDIDPLSVENLQIGFAK